MGKVKNVFTEHQGGREVEGAQHQLVAQGKPEDILTPALMQEVYSLDCVVMEDPVSHTPYVVPKGRYHTGTALGCAE